MRKFITAVFALALAGPAISSHARTPASLVADGLTVSGSNQASGGLMLVVSTSGFAFTPVIGPILDPPVATGTTAAAVQGIDVSVALRNHTGQDISFQLGFTGIPGEKFHFRVYNSDGALVWDSLPSVTPALVRIATLKAGEAWHGTAVAPLFINGKALPAGAYTLETSLYGSPGFSSMTSFVVNNPVVID